MDSLQKCAKAFDQLTRYQYHFVIGRKGQTLKFTVSFDPSDFHHLAGLHKLKDNVRLQTGQRSAIFQDILDGKYPFEPIKHSAYFREMEQRLTPLSHLEKFMDSNEIIFRYNEKANRFSAIQADYLLQNDVEEIPVYVFLAQRTGQQTYDNCTREPVYQFFVQKLKTSPGVAEILTNIITYNGGIPTGCPTSQIMAFYAYSDMFSEIFDLAKQHGCKFTLYVDDMTFSSKEPFSPHQLSQMIDRVLRKYGHKPKYPKVKYYGPSDYKPITGTVVTSEHSLAVPNGLQKTIYDAFQTVKPLIGVETCSEEDARQILSLKGQIQAACNIEDGKFPEIRRLTNQIKVPDSQSVSTRKRQHHRRSKKIHIKQQAPIK